MSLSAEADKVENLEFKWGKKRGVGGKKKEVQFYDSFTYDGVDYILHDCVYMYKEGEPKPYIGKLIKIWENGDKTKKVKVQWFFHPSEILNWLRGEEALPNEIFLASGEGAGVANVNPLEAIAGKCNVVCISKGSRNPQPSEQEIRMADYIFYRTFDVRHCTISDKMDDKVGGLEVKFVFNSKESEMISGAPLDCVKKEEAVACNQTLQLPRQNPPEEFKTPGKGIEKISGVPLASEKKEEAVACNQTLQPSGKNPPEEFKTTKTDGHSNHLVAKGCADLKDSLVKGKPASCAAMDSDDVPTTSGQRGTVSGDKTTRNMNSIHKLTVHENDAKALVTTITYPEGKAKTGPGSGSGSGFLGPDRGIKSVKDTGASEDRPSKKARVDSSIKLSENKNNNGVRKASINSDGNNAKDLADTLPSGGKTKSKVASLGWDKDLQPKTDEKMMKLTKSKVSSFGPDKDLQQKTDEKMAKLSNGKLLKVSARETPGDRKTEGEVTRRPDDERSKWFKALPWEERLKSTHEQGTLVHLSNLDPEYTSGEVEDIIWHAFKEYCTAKMIQRTAISSPHSGQAFVILKTKGAAEKIIKELGDGCLMLSNGRPLVGSMAPPPSFLGKQSTFTGHLFVDKSKHQMQREMKEAVSTSHCSQPNTIEYEMAMEWRLLQSRSDRWWKLLYKRQGEELRKLKSNLKLK
ncbi:unnamed protein product [Camellia sinensis]